MHASWLLAITLTAGAAGLLTTSVANAHGAGYAARYLAKRFAAKEAFGKALGVGLHAPMSLHSLQVLNDARGRPIAQPRKALAAYMAERGLVAHVSLSDETDSAVAFVIVESPQEPRT